MNELRNLASLVKVKRETEDFLADCVAMVECLRVLKEKGVEGLDTEGVELRTDVFDRCFPGIEWEESKDRQGRPIGLRVKTTEYRGFLFDAVELDEEMGIVPVEE